MNKYLLTGFPGSGKTTVIVRLADLLKGKKIVGFYTEEIREAGQRTGFLSRTFAGQTSILSSVKFHKGPRVGRYRVDVEGFEEAILPELSTNETNADLYLIDEIGKMECFSDKFVSMMKQILDSAMPTVATVALKGSGFISQVKNRKDIELITVTAQNRDVLPARIAGQLGF